MSQQQIADALTELRTLLGTEQTLDCSASKVAVASILDEFSHQCFQFELQLWPIHPGQGDLDVTLIRPGMLLVESAWNGNRGLWRDMITSKTGPKPSLVRLIRVCRELGIPTVFWNKEDPPHFQDFLATAKHFDYVLTTDADMIPRYREACPNASVELLRFAASETLHNPSRVSQFRQGEIAFAGQFFTHKFPERREQMEILFEAATKFNFSIFSRVLGGDRRYQFPERYDQFVRGSLAYSEMVNEYKRHKIFLNVNSVVTSKTMCARRIFELTASKTAVVGMHSEAIRSVYNEDEVVTVRDSKEASECFERMLSDDAYRREVVQKAWRKTLSAHTYRHRTQALMELIGIPQQTQSLTVELTVKRTDNSVPLDAVLNDLAAQEFTCIDTPVLLKWSEFGQEQNDNPHWQRDSIKIIGEVDAGYHYGHHYVEDLILAMRQQKAAVVAKTPQGRVADEESYQSRVPPHGWLALAESSVQIAPPTGRYQTISGTNRASATKTPAERVYWSDPMEVERVSEINSTVVEEGIH